MTEEAQTAETTPVPLQDQLEILNARMEIQEVEIAMVKRALLSLGSTHLAGGEPGPAVYLAWHDNEMNPKLPEQSVQEPSPATPVASSPPSSPPPPVPPHQHSNAGPSGGTMASGSSPAPPKLPGMPGK